MGWQAVAFYVCFCVLLFLWARSAGISRSLRDEREKWKLSCDDWEQAATERQIALNELRDKYDSLIEKIASQSKLTPPAKKEDDSVIHARNAGDVRRQFEKAMGEQSGKQTDS